MLSILLGEAIASGTSSYEVPSPRSMGLKIKPSKIQLPSKGKFKLSVDSVEKLRAEFLQLMKSYSKLKTWDDFEYIRAATIRWAEQYETILVQIRDELKSRSVEYRAKLYKERPNIEWAKGYEKQIGKAWRLESEMRSFGVSSWSYYQKYEPTVTKEQLFERAKRALPTWERRVRKAAQNSWKLLSEIGEWAERSGWYGGGGEAIDIKRYGSENVMIEGFDTEVIGYDDADDGDRESMAKLRAGLGKYVQRASRVYPWLLKYKLPIRVYFSGDETERGDWLARYEKTYMSVSSSGLVLADVDELAKAFAHEMGHHIYEQVISGQARKDWGAFISGNNINLDLRDVIAKMRPGESEGDFERRIKDEDPILYLQLNGLAYDNEYRHLGLLGAYGIKKHLDDGGTPVLVVNSKPISAYGAKNKEEAFCEAFGLAVAHGPRAVLPDVLVLLKAVLPGFKAESKGVAMRLSQLLEDQLVEYEQYVDDEGYIWDDEGNKGGYVGREYAGQTFGLHDAPRVMGGGDGGSARKAGPPSWQSQTVRDQLIALKAAIKKKPDKFLSSVAQQIYMWGDRSAKVPSPKQKDAIVRALERLGMYDEAKLFGGKGKPSSEQSGGSKAAQQNAPHVDVITKALGKWPTNNFLVSIRDQLNSGRKLSPKQNQAVKNILARLKMSDDEMKLFEGLDLGPEDINTLAESLEGLVEVAIASGQSSYKVHSPTVFPGVSAKLKKQLIARDIKMNPRQSHEIDLDWIKGIKKWWQKVLDESLEPIKVVTKGGGDTVPKWFGDESGPDAMAHYKMEMAASETMRALDALEQAVDLLKGDLLVNKGFWTNPAGLAHEIGKELEKKGAPMPKLIAKGLFGGSLGRGSAKGGVKKILQKKFKELQGAHAIPLQIVTAFDDINKIFDEKRRYIEHFVNDSNPKGNPNAPGGQAMTVPKNLADMKFTLRGFYYAVEECASLVTKKLDGVFKKITSLMKDQGGGVLRRSDPERGRWSRNSVEAVPESVHVGGFIVQFQDQIDQEPSAPAHFVPSHMTIGGGGSYVPVSPTEATLKNRNDIIGAVRKAEALLKKNGLKEVVYGSIIKLPEGSYENLVGIKKSAAAAYWQAGDIVKLFGVAEAGSIVHELGHRYWFKFMSPGDRNNFSRWFGKVPATSSYGATSDIEDFAETFETYVMGWKMSRDQRQRFEQFLGRKQKLEMKNAPSEVLDDAIVNP